MYYHRTGVFLLYTLSIVSFILATQTMEEDPDDLSTQLFCPEDLPVGIYGDPEENRGMRQAFELVGHTWYGWSSLNFTSLAHLCSANGNQRGNMGGRVRPFGVSGLTIPDLRSDFLILTG